MKKNFLNALRTDSDCDVTTVNYRPRYQNWNESESLLTPR